MEPKLFEELLEAVGEMKAIRQGSRRPARETDAADLEVDAAAIRKPRIEFRRNDR